MAMFKLCRCNKPININIKMCDDCLSKYDQDKKEIHKKYKKVRKDVWEQRFYSSKAWRNKRQYVILRFNGFCLWSWYTKQKLIPATTVHHIVPLKDSRAKALSDNNLIPLTHEAHNEIENMYLKNKKATQDEIKKAVELWEKDNLFIQIVKRRTPGG